MDLLTLRDRRTRLLVGREYMLAANRLTRPPPWHSGGRRWAVSASTVTMAEREARLVPRNTESCPPTFWSLQRSEPAKPGLRRARTAYGASYAERTRFKPQPYRAEPCHTGETLRECLNNEFLKNFNAEQLTHVDTATRNTLPTQQTISDEQFAIHSERSHSARWGTKRSCVVQFNSAPVTRHGERRPDNSVGDDVTIEALNSHDSHDTTENQDT